MVHFLREVKVTNIVSSKGKGTVKKINFVGMRKSLRQGNLFSNLKVYFVERGPHFCDQEIESLHILESISIK